jgi:antitoxin ParD1/3/4
LVEEGHYSSVSAVVQQGLEMLREQTEMKEAELAALRALLDERRKGPFLTMEESHAQIQEMVSSVKASYGL